MHLDLQVLETCVKNCGHRFHVLVASQDFVESVLVRTILPKNNPPTIVHDKVLNLIQVSSLTGWDSLVTSRGQGVTRPIFLCQLVNCLSLSTYSCLLSLVHRVRRPGRRKKGKHFCPLSRCQGGVVSQKRR